ncbi:MAG: M13 family metallopeptidase [Candidatus Eremiobacterota bacterium]
MRVTQVTFGVPLARQVPTSAATDRFQPAEAAALPFYRPVPALTRPVFRGYDRSDMDLTVSPGADFYRYAVGGYLARRPIPEDRSRSGVDEDLYDRTQINLKRLLEEMAGPPGSEERKLADLYASGMDTAAIDAAGVAPIQPFLDRIQAIASPADLLDSVAELHSYGIPAMFGFGPGVDLKDSTRVVAETYQGGMGLPERDYYFKADEESARTRDAYRSHIARMFELTGDDPEAARRRADRAFELEKRLAEGALSRVEMRDPAAMYNPTSRADLRGLDWDRYLERVGQAGVDSLNVATPKFFQKLEETLAAVPLEDWKDYLRWQVLNATAAYLSSDLESQDFDFKYRTLKGIQAQPPRWKRVLRTVDESMGEALGKQYVQRHFPPEAKARVLEMVDTIKLVLEDRLERLTWMSEETRQQALEKLDSFTQKIGYPDRWTDYSALAVQPGDYAQNVLNASRFAVRQRMDTIGKPVDRTRWEMTPPTINAYYQPLANEIVFPAAILQPPYFDPKADDATNYGAIGAVIGHEIGHGFDDEGAQFDARGNLRNWWSEGDLQRFRERTAGVERQFSEFRFGGLQVDGKLVLGEALADLGGLELAYEAYKLARERKPPAPSPDGFTDDQRFFLSFARSWATNLRPEMARLIMTTDPHPLPHFRVNGTLANFEPFHRAFGLQPGDPLVRPPEQRNTLWGP